MSEEKPKSVPIKDLISEDGAHELAASPDMQPYLRLIKAGLQDHDTTPHMEEIAALVLTLPSISPDREGLVVSTGLNANALPMKAAMEASRQYIERTILDGFSVATTACAYLWRYTQVKH
jgi:hypothetical protein